MTTISKGSTIDLHVIVAPERNPGIEPSGGYEQMAKRRFQAPTPKKRGQWWTLLVWQDVFVDGKPKRQRVRVKLAPSTTTVREVLKISAEYLRPVNQGLITIGSAAKFSDYCSTTYMTTVLPLMAKSTQGRTKGVIANYLQPAFGNLCLRDLTPLTLQRYFTGLVDSELSYESKDKIRDVLSSILVSAKKYGLLVTNPAEGLRLPRDKKGRRSKPYIDPLRFAALLELLPEPYQSMVFVAVYTGLRVSELAALRWKNVHVDSITIDERFSRGDWGAPKSESSNATIAVNRAVIERLHRLKTLKVDVRAGCAVRTYTIVKASGPDDLVFQSVRTGAPMRDNNILSRFIKPAGVALAMPWVNWRCLRTSHATWLKLAGADIKDAQAQMRHSRATTTLDIYQQFVPESQRKVVDKLTGLGHSAPVVN